MVTTVGTGGGAPAAVYTDIHATTVASLRSVGVIHTCQVAVTVVTLTTIGAVLVAGPAIPGACQHTGLLHRAGTLTASWSTLVAVTVVATIGRATGRTIGPLVAGGRSTTNLRSQTTTLATSGITLVAVPAVTTHRTGGRDPTVAGARELTDLLLSAGASATSRYTGVAESVVTTICTTRGLPGVLGRTAGAAAVLLVSTVASVGVARCTSIAERGAALTVVVGVGTLARADRVGPGTVVLTGLEVRLTAVLVTHLLTAGVVGLVEGVVRTVAISSASRSITARATGVLASPGVVSLRAIKLTGLCISVGATLSVGRAVMTDTSETAVRTGGGVPAVVAAAVHHTKLLVAT